MKKILLLIPFILGFCLYTGAQSTTGTRVTSMVVPNDSADDYSTHDSYFGRGGYRSVKTITERDAIKTSRKANGMLVYVLADSHTYRLVNSAWVQLSEGGGTWGSITGTLSDQTDLNAILTGKESSLGNPLANGYVLSSTTSGVRSWVPMTSSGGVTPINNILQWDATKNYYTPYPYDKTNGIFRLSKSDKYIPVATNPNDSMLVVNGGIVTQTNDAPAAILHSNNAEGGTIYSDNGIGGSIYSSNGPGANIYTVNGFNNLVVGNGYDTTCFRQDGSIVQYKSGVKKFEVQTDGSVNIPTGSNYKINGVPISSGGGVWGSITGTLSNQTDLKTALNAKEPTITAGTTAQYYRGDKTWQTLNSSAVGLGNVLNLAQEPALGNPSVNGYVLSSTTSGVRSWIAAESALGNPAADGYVLSSTTTGVRSWVPNSATVTNNSVFNDSVYLLISPTSFSTLTGISLTAGTWLINYGGENSGSWNNNAQNSNIFFSLGSTAWDGTSGTINTRSSIRGYYANFNRSLVVTITGTQSVWLRIKRAVEAGSENCCIRSIYMTALKLNN